VSAYRDGAPLAPSRGAGAEVKIPVDGVLRPMTDECVTHRGEEAVRSPSMISSLDRKILIWPEAFSSEECELLTRRFDWTKHGVKELPELAAEITAMLEPRTPRCPKMIWTPFVTLSMQQVGWHLDSAHGGATHKLCLYLDDSNVGTEFQHPFGLWEGPWCGSICLFDIGLEHRTAGAVRHRRVLGLRAREVSR